MLEESLLLEGQSLVVVHNKVEDYVENLILDSRCSNHMTGDQEKLCELSKYKGQ